MSKRETQGLQRVIEAHKAKARAYVTEMPKRHERIPARAQANVPYDELAGRLTITLLATRQALAQTKLPDVERFGFSNRSCDRMECFTIRHGTDAERTVSEANQCVTAAQSGHRSPK